RPPESTSLLPSLSAFTRTRPDRIRVSTAEVAEEVEDGPVELPPSAISPFSSTNSIFATSDDLTPLQLATSVMLTSAITTFLFRSIRRRAKHSKEMLKSSGVKKSLKDEASTTPSAAQAFLGAVSACVIAVILYKFTTTIEAGLNRQTISDNFSCAASYIHYVKGPLFMIIACVRTWKVNALRV
ncbi:unnamed protein product, partial [Brassica napus]